MKIFVSRATQQLAVKYLLYIVIGLIPFSIRYVFESSLNLATGIYSDFTSISLYINDFAIVLLIILASDETIFKGRKIKIWVSSAIALLIWLLLEIIIVNSSYLSLQSYFTGRLILLIALAYSILKIQVSRENIAWLFSILGGIQALIAIIQFKIQRSIGLYWLGESHLSPTTDGVAKIVSYGTTLIRGYGTFPHANILAAFLVCTTILNIYLISKNYQKSRGILAYILLLVNTVGIFITFSRGGIIALIIGLTILAIYFLIYKQFSRATKILAPAVISIALSVVILLPYLGSRTTVSDNAVKLRSFYNHIGKEIVQDAPFTGLGAGTSVLHMKHYTETKLEPWQIQPIHNFYLISWAEIGIGAVLLIFVILLPILALIKRNMSFWQITLFAIGIAFLALFIIDHYFYTTWQSQILLWVIVGLSLKELVGKSTYDTLYQQE